MKKLLEGREATQARVGWQAGTASAYWCLTPGCFCSLSLSSPGLSRKWGGGVLKSKLPFPSFSGIVGGPLWLAPKDCFVADLGELTN